MSAPYQTRVNCQYGAPMGRRANTSERDYPVKFYLRRVPLIDGDYDQGGAYWGGGRGTLPLYCAWGDAVEEQQVIYLRAPSRDAARQLVRETFPNCKFWG